MGRQKELDDATRINLVMDRNEVNDLDKLSSKTGLSRSKLIRIGCRVLVSLSTDTEMNDNRRESLLKILKPIYDKFGWTYNKKNVKLLINDIYSGIRNYLISDAIAEIESHKRFDVIFLDDTTEIVTLAKEFTPEEIGILREVIRIEKAKRSAKTTRKK